MNCIFWRNTDISILSGKTGYCKMISFLTLIVCIIKQERHTSSWRYNTTYQVGIKHFQSCSYMWTFIAEVTIVVVEFSYRFIGLAPQHKLSTWESWQIFSLRQQQQITKSWLSTKPKHPTESRIDKNLNFLQWRLSYSEIDYGQISIVIDPSILFLLVQKLRLMIFEW